MQELCNKKKQTHTVILSKNSVYVQKNVIKQQYRKHQKYRLKKQNYTKTQNTVK